MTIADIERAIARLSAPAKELEATVNSSLSPFCTRLGYPYISRIKGEPSICQKIETGRYRRLLDIDDLVAFTIIIPTSAHEAKCVEFLSKNFEVQSVKTKAKSVSNPKNFTFDSTRVYAKYRCPEWDENKGKIIYQIIFEIQIRAALEHAWVTATHDVVYKSDTVDWQKVRLAAQIKAQIETVDQIFSNFESFAKTVESLSWKEEDQTSRLITFFQQMQEEGVIPLEKLPVDRIRLSENAIKLLSRRSLLEMEGILSEIAKELRKIAVKGFPQNLTLLQTFLLAATRSQKQNQPSEKFTPHITGYFSRMFSEVNCWGRGFSYELQFTTPAAPPPPVPAPAA